MKIDKHHLPTLFTLALIILLAAYFRLPNITTNPGWFTDEGTHLEVARSILNGRTQYLAVQDSVLLFSRLPLFGHLLALLGRFFGLNITTLRLLTATLSLISIPLLSLLTMRLTRQKSLALTAAFILAIFPAAITYGRFGLSYNLLTPLLLLTCLGLWEYHQTNATPWLILAALTIGLGTISDLWMISYLPVLILTILLTPSNQFRTPFEKSITTTANPSPFKTLAWALPLALLPLAAYTLHALATTPEPFLFDLNFVRTRLSLSLIAQLQSLLTNITVLLSQDGWIALGFIGLLALPRLEQRRFLLLFLLLPFAILGRSTALHGLGFHYFIPFLPFIALGLAALLWRGLPLLAESIPIITNPPLKKALALAIIAIPLLTTLSLLNDQLNGRYQTAIDPFLANPADAAAVAAFINNSLHEDNLVIANATITWLLKTNRADFQVSLAATGLATPHLPANLPPTRFAFNPDYHQADLVVIDNWWYTWGQFNLPGLTQMIDEVTTWPLIFSSGDMKIYKNDHSNEPNPLDSPTIE